THAATKVGPVTPPPPPGAGPGPQTPSAFGYVTPSPPQRDRSGSPLALIILGIVAVLGIAAAVLAASGVFSKESSPSAETFAHASTALEKQPQSSKHSQPKKVEPPKGSASCPEEKGVWVNGVTSCPFAVNTRSAYAEAGGAHKIQVYSPVTGQTYEMSCAGTS